MSMMMLLAVGVLLLAVLLAGCGKAEMENRGWCLPLEDETVLTTTDGEEFAATEGEAVENEYGNYLITDTNGAQRLVDGKGNLLAQASAGAALCVCHSAVMRGILAREEGLSVAESYRKIKLPNGSVFGLQSLV